MRISEDVTAVDCITMGARIAVNGEIAAQGEQFAVQEVEVVTAVVDLDTVVGFRGAFQSMSVQAAASEKQPMIEVPFSLCVADPLGAGFQTHASAVPRARGGDCDGTRVLALGLSPTIWCEWIFVTSRVVRTALPLLLLLADVSARDAAAAAGDACAIADIKRIAQLDDNASVPTAKELAARVLTTVYPARRTAATRPVVVPKPWLMR